MLFDLVCGSVKDLLDSPILADLEWLIDTGRVNAIIATPLSCETWFLACWMCGGPPPLCMDSYPWDAPGLSKRKMPHVRVGVQ